ncbi:hypothetical protein Are01nite_07230 [Actinoplanes regularis]|nr:hypothetical protein Are01nite_07230 [Actinoplanes regularis]
MRTADKIKIHFRVRPVGPRGQAHAESRADLARGPRTPAPCRELGMGAVLLLTTGTAGRRVDLALRWDSCTSLTMSQVCWSPLNCSPPCGTALRISRRWCRRTTW